jgi:hypothetical protein
MIEVYLIIKDSTQQYYLLKVVRRDFDVYCFIPDLGAHHSLHRSGESHFRHEGKVAKPGGEPPVALIMGEAGKPIKNGIKSTSLCGLGRAAGICTAIFSIASLNQDFRKFKRSTVECFVIDTELFPKETKAVQGEFGQSLLETRLALNSTTRTLMKICCIKWPNAIPRFGYMLSLYK